MRCALSCSVLRICDASERSAGGVTWGLGAAQVVRADSECEKIQSGDRWLQLMRVLWDFPSAEVIPSHSQHSYITSDITGDPLPSRCRRQHKQEKACVCVARLLLTLLVFYWVKSCVVYASNQKVIILKMFCFNISSAPQNSPCSSYSRRTQTCSIKK